MSFSKLTTSSAVLTQLVAFASAQGTFSNSIAGVYTITQDTGGDIPLISKHFAWPDLPYQADTGTGPRGTQQGYNLCNTTTQNQNSWCQTAFMNSIDDFCLWGSPVPDSTVGAIEEEMVAYCTKPKYGTRMIPQNALQGVQWIVTPDYVEVVGMIDQTVLALQSNDTGGEEDPHGADNRGNPLGSLLYSSAFLKTNPNDKNYTQVIEWSYFVGSGTFCFKACDPAGANAASLCQHTYDEVGCVYNDPANYGGINGTFTSCQGEDQLPVGVYVTNGVTSTWAQPASFTAVPYTPSIPATSSCTTYTSSALYTALVTSTTTTTTSATSTSSKSNSSKGSATGSSSSATSTGSNSSNSNKSGAVSDVRMSGVALVGSLLGSFAALGWALI